MSVKEPWESVVVCSVALVTGCATSPPRETVESSIRSALPGDWDWADASARFGDSAAQFHFSEDGWQVRAHVATGVYLDSTLLGPKPQVAASACSPAASR